MLNTLQPPKNPAIPELSEAHRFDPSILREYDIRGVVGETITVMDAKAIGLAFGTMVRQLGGTRVCIGRDGRIHSQALYSALAKGLQSTGINVIAIGVGPTPMLYFADRVFESDGAIMVTGSHNPPEYNGFKLVLGHQPFFGEDLQSLGQLAGEGSFVEGDGRRSNVDIAGKYINALDSSSIARPLKVAWDPGNGAAAQITAQLVRRLPGHHIVINEEIDGTFPNHHPDPTVPENLEQLRDVVIREHCAFGIAFDGDGDRIGVIDDEGEILWGDQLLSLIAESVLNANPGATIIADVKASQILFDRITKLGGRAMMCKTGHSLIKSKMNETGAILAGEMSGHMFFADRYFGFDDALYAAVRLLEVVASRTQPLSSYRKALPQVYNTPELRIECPDELKFKALATIEDTVAQSGADAITIDGVRVTTQDGWWLLRASNTQPALVARCESQTFAGLASLKATLIEHLRSAGVTVPDNLKNN
ncbi:MAG: phosphomannomutase/phosphoglucomutase [Magnetovibrio sp.]|nr:phosphomannomutase/phosphoglucomutase [Magnetovibrio sp.]